MKDVAMWLRNSVCDPEQSILTIINRHRPQAGMDRRIEGEKIRKEGQGRKKNGHRQNRMGQQKAEKISKHLENS